MDHAEAEWHDVYETERAQSRAAMAPILAAIKQREPSPRDIAALQTRLQEHKRFVAELDVYLATRGATREIASSRADSQ